MQDRIIDNSKHTPGIMKLLNEQHEVKVEDVCEKLNVSSATARRIFARLEVAGIVERYWGGIRLSGSALFHHQVPIGQRQTSQLNAKKTLAEEAAKLVQNGDVIIIDGGTTTAEMVPFLTKKKIKVITNSILIAQAFDHQKANNQGPEILLTGGWLQQELGLLNGSETRETLRKYLANKVFLSPAALDENYLTNHNPDIAETEQTMIQQAEKLIVLADASKIGQKHMCKICSITEADLLLVNETDDMVDFYPKIINATNWKFIPTKQGRKR